MSKKPGKKLKMERISPIPPQDRLLLPSDTFRTPVRSQEAISRRQTKDAYAIETTSSPEFVKARGSSVPKPRRYRRARKAAKTPISTPLTGLIAKKPAPSPLEDLHFSDPFSSNSTGLPSPSNEPIASSQPPPIDDYSPEKPVHFLRHSEIISAAAVFPQKPQASASATTPLAGLVNRKASNDNRSLNDSLSILQEAADPSDDEAAGDNGDGIPESEKITIENFTSPAKSESMLLLHNASTSSMFLGKHPIECSSSIFKTFCPNASKNKSSYSLLPPGIENMSLVNEELREGERKNRRRALDFNSTVFMASKRTNESSGYLPLLSTTIPCQERGESQTIKTASPNPDCARGSSSCNVDIDLPFQEKSGKSAVLDISPRSPPPVLNVQPCSRTTDLDRCRSPVPYIKPVSPDYVSSSPTNLSSNRGQLPSCSLVPPCREPQIRHLLSAKSDNPPAAKLGLPWQGRVPKDSCNSSSLGRQSQVVKMGTTRGDGNVSPVINLMQARSPTPLLDSQSCPEQDGDYKVQQQAGATRYSQCQGADDNSPVYDVEHRRTPSPVLNLYPRPQQQLELLPWLDASSNGGPVHDRKTICCGTDENSRVFDIIAARTPSPVLCLYSRPGQQGNQSPLLDGLSDRGPVCNEKTVYHSTKDNSPVVLDIMGARSPSPVLNLYSGPEKQRDVLPSLHASPDSNPIQSPILDLQEICHREHGDPAVLDPTLERSSSPVLSLTSVSLNPASPPAFYKMSANGQLEPADQSKSPTLDIAATSREYSCHLPLQNLLQNSPVLQSGNQISEPDFQLLEPTAAESHSPFQKQDGGSPSDSESIIDSTPSRLKSRDRNCERIKNDDHSPPRPGSHVESAEIEVFEETQVPKHVKCNLEFVVVSHDTSDESMMDCDEEKVISNSCDMIMPTIGSHSPRLDLNYTKRPIESFTSPSKGVKPFSEAVNIDAVCSPDSNASYHQDEDRTTDEFVEPSTTQEYVEESEQVRPTKRRKKGSLLERAKGVMSRIDASNALYDYELKCGLRPAKGKYVSAPLVVMKTPKDESSVFLVCKPLKYFKGSLHDDRCSFVLVHVSKLPTGVSSGSVVLLHFPLNIVYSSELHLPCIFAGHRIVSHNERIDVSAIDLHPLESINHLSLPYSKPSTSFRTFSSVLVRTLSEAALGQNLVEELNLYLTVLHVTKHYKESVSDKFEENPPKKITVLCYDEELVPCWLEFSSERDISRAVVLEIFCFLSDGSQIQTKGFAVVDGFRLDRKTKNLLNYCTSGAVVNCETGFSVCPKETDWVISPTGGSRQVKKMPSKIADILSNKTPGRRYLLEVYGVEKEPLSVKDSDEQTIALVVGVNSCLENVLELKIPFFLDAAYYCDGKLFADEHTRIAKMEM